MISCIKNLPVPERDPESSYMVLLSLFADLGGSTIRAATRKTRRLSSASPGSKAPGRGMPGADSYEGLLLTPMPPLTTTGPERDTVHSLRQSFPLEAILSRGGRGKEGTSPPCHHLTLWPERKTAAPLPFSRPSLLSCSLFPFHTHTCTPRTD